MSGIIFLGRVGTTVVDYSAVDGRIERFVLDGETLYEEGVVEVPGWKDRLKEFVIECGLNVNDGHGLHAFVYRMIDDGIL